MRNHYRTYKHYYKGENLELIAWVQRRCEVCQRFLSKDQISFCSKCKQQNHNKANRKYRKMNVNYVESARKWRDKNKDYDRRYSWTKRHGGLIE